MRSLLAFWLGGGGADTTSPVAPAGGYRSLLGYWSGGAAGGVDAPVEEETAAGRPESFILPNGMRFRGTYAEAQSLWARLGRTDDIVPARTSPSEGAEVALEARPKTPRGTTEAKNEQQPSYHNALALLLLEA